LIAGFVGHHADSKTGWPDNFLKETNMLTQEIPANSANASKKFRGADPIALVVLVVAVGLLAVIFLATYLR